MEEADSSILGILNDAIPAAEQNFANDMITVHVSTVTVNRENVDASFEKGTYYVHTYYCICESVLNKITYVFVLHYINHIIITFNSLIRFFYIILYVTRKLN